MDELAFSACWNLKSIVIPKSITIIGKWAFDYCENLTDIYYTGTESEWNEIVINSGNDNLLNATVHYNYKPISIAWDSNLKEVNFVSDFAKGYQITFANYSSGKISKIKPVTVTFSSAGTKTVSLPSGMSTSGLRIFLWDSLESMKPLADAITVD